MGEIKANTIVNSAGTGSVNIASDIKIKGVPLDSVNTLGYTVDSAEPASPKDAAIWYDDVNTTLKMYIANEWKTIDYTIPTLYTQGSISGYSSGGAYNAFDPGQLDTIEKFSFVADANATDVANLTQARSNAAGHSSDISGYTSSGYTRARVNTIDKFPFAADANATDVGDLTASIQGNAGQFSETYGYSSSGMTGTAYPTARNVIEKFPFATDANATDVGDLTVTRGLASGLSSADTNIGYTAGGNGPPAAPSSNVIDKFPFATDANATDVGDLVAGLYRSQANDGETHGYVTSGVTGIEKFSFASDGNSTSVGSLTVGRAGGAGTSSVSSGYTAAGGSYISNIIDKFPFATDANATDVGDLTRDNGRGTAGQQV